MSWGECSHRLLAVLERQEFAARFARGFRAAHIRIAGRNSFVLVTKITTIGQDSLLI
jgi:hypothetical protein